MYTEPPIFSAQPHAGPRGPGGILTMARNVQDWLDARGRGAWIAATVLAFVFVWPLGLALLAYMIWSKRMFTRSCGEGRARDFRNGWGSQFSGGCGHRHGFRSSGNTAFDAYKEETLRRLQEEQEAFQSFLQRLREAKDKTEFDAFMDERARQARGNPPANDGNPA